MTTTTARNIRTAVITTIVSLVGLLLVTAAKRYDESKETVSQHAADIGQINAKMDRLLDAFCEGKVSTRACK